MKPIAVFYHIALCPPIDLNFGLNIYWQQMRLLEGSGLLEAASHLHIGVNATAEQASRLDPHTPTKAERHVNGENARSEIPTMRALQKWLPGHEDWYVCYAHSKGITKTDYEPYIRWRRCMESHVIANWRKCVADLDGAYESVGAHWISRAPNPQYNDHKLNAGADWNLNGHIWGGNFWWTKASFLSTLPALPENSRCRDEDFLAEIWIGSGKRDAIAKDYAPHWPTTPECQPVSRRCYLLKK